MTTPQEIIKKFRDNFVKQGIPIGIREYTSKDNLDITASKIESFIISTVIKQYEEVLGKIKNLEKPICRCMCEKNKITLAYNDCVFDTFSIIESKIKEWKLIYEK